MATKQLEKEIQLAICDYLEIMHKNNPDIMWWRQNTTPVFDKGFFRPMPKYSMTGLPDIFMINKGVFWGIEVKQPKGKQSENQRIFQKKCEKAGGKYYIVTSLDDIIALGL